MDTHAARLPAVVVVDDEPDVVIILYRILRDVLTVYDIISAATGREVLAALAARPIALVIADYNMPGMNGLELTAAVKVASPRTRVMLITAYDTPALGKQARQHVDFYLPKPFAFAVFEEMVRAALA